MLANLTKTDKETARGHACRLVWWSLLLTVWVNGCRTAQQQQVCAKPGAELIKFIFSRFSRTTDDAEEAAAASDY